ncbi:glutathione S-transferase [Mycena maculata]|uniref:glutathione transferase n=1 Tax=Mycena maculata TaxID=230809 RepID=A0AAD7MSQ8_9AGAR|nr:glutathione S-transferase [Mycena maculata]
MVLKLYGPDFTPGGSGVVCMVLAELQLPYELVFIDMFAGEHKGAAYLEKQPFGKVPVMEDDGFILYESRAICRYLVQKYPATGLCLMPPETETESRAAFEQAASIEFATFEPYARTVYLQKIIQPLLRLPIDQVVLDRALENLTATLNVYEVILGKQRFLAGDEFTLADLFHVAFGSTLETAGCDLLSTSGPNVARWWREIIERPSWAGLKDGLRKAAAASCS